MILQNVEVLRCPNCVYKGAIDEYEYIEVTEDIEKVQCPKCGYIFTVPDDNVVIEDIKVSPKDVG